MATMFGCSPVELFAFECLACRVKRKPTQQNLIGLSKCPSTTCRPVEISGFVDALMFFDPDFTNVDPDPIEHQPANLSRERTKPSLDKQRELPLWTLDSRGTKASYARRRRNSASPNILMQSIDVQ
jgi:hypothetical protein